MATDSRTRKILVGVAALAGVACSLSGPPPRTLFAATAAEVQPRVSQGSLISVDKDGNAQQPCPLKHTNVAAEISGFLARVTVTQEFENPLPETIEAVYVFPLPRRAAVDDMTMQIADRTVKGKIKRREEARAIYEAAKARGHLASLLDQERPNIFIQSVANIPPGAKVNVVISYVETLNYEEGSYEFSFPMVVGPRYIPRQVSDGSRITPPVTKEGTRAGHDLSLTVKLDAGLPVDRIDSKSHEIDMERRGLNGAEIRLRQTAVIPNKDFVLRYDVAGGKIQDAVLAHRAERGGFFTLILQPPERVTAEDVTPKELVFVLDTSGSMSGFPIEKAKEVIKLAIDGLYPRDTFNLITFSGDSHILFPEPVPATTENIRMAQEFLASRRGSGGTEMMKAIRAALDPSDNQKHVRIVCFLTDGYVGNDMEIVGEIRRHPNARVFSFGVGSSVNRFLLDKMAEESRGEVEYVALNDDGSAAARRFHERVRNPLLTDIAIDWSGLPVADVYPARIPDLFGAKPVILSGRYTAPASGVIRLRGTMSGRAFSREIRVNLPAGDPRHDVLATLWARNRVEDLMSQDWNGMQSGSPRTQIKEAIVQLGIDYRLMTQFTSFVAVEETVVTEGGAPRRIEVPVEMPEGVSYEGIFGERSEWLGARTANFMITEAAPSRGVIGGAAPAPAVMAERKADIFRLATPSKLHPDLVSAAAGRVPAGLAVRDGKVEVEIWLADANPRLLQQLKALGFEITVQPKIAKVLIGRIAVNRLKEVAKLEGVRYVTPFRGR
ncbi:MAG: VWA domain-containing protein [Bryobacteraceae bacterium]|nr:VWA domain-containing protein [Bryobacteraceae bacterium]